MAFNVIASVTDIGRQRLAQALITGKSFKVDKFVVGSGGHDPLDPTSALTPDVTIAECPTPVFGPEPIDATILASQFCPQFTCVLNNTDAVAALSNICLIATVIFSPVPNDPEVLNGTTFVFAVANFPLRVKTDTETVQFTVTVQF